MLPLPTSSLLNLRARIFHRPFVDLRRPLIGYSGRFELSVNHLTDGGNANLLVSALYSHDLRDQDLRGEETAGVPPLKRNAGFTLYELLITVIVASVIAVYGIPGFQNLMANSRSVTATNDLITALNLARSEATRRRTPINVCSSADGATCSASNDWSTGWVVLTAAGQVLQTWPARAGGAGVLNANVSNVQFQATGSLAAGAAPTLALQLPHCTGTGRRNVTISPAGRIAVDRVNCT